MDRIFRGAFARWIPLLRFEGSQRYWKERYRLGGNSGAGSMRIAAHYKAGVLNDFVSRQAVGDVIEFGCGDGHQLDLATYPAYLGVDISRDAIRLCNDRFTGDASKRFVVLDQYRQEQADLALSLDVVYHLVEDDVYDEYMTRLFSSARRFVIIYSSDEPVSSRTLPHVRHRSVSTDVASRFQSFARMRELEDGLPKPVEFNRGIPTRFLIYKRQKEGLNDTL